eukprot:g22133.t1
MLTTVTPKDGEIYCLACYASHYGPGGFRGGAGGGTVAMGRKYVQDPSRAGEKRSDVAHGVTIDAGGDSVYMAQHSSGSAGKVVPAADATADKAKFCGDCGTKADGGKFCGNCGATL